MITGYGTKNSSECSKRARVKEEEWHKMFHITVIALNFLSNKKVRGSQEDRYSGNKGVACFFPTM